MEPARQDAIGKMLASMKQRASKNIAPSNPVSCNKVTNENRAQAKREGDWLERPRDIFVLMSRFSVCSKVKTLLTTLPVDFEARYTAGHWDKFEVRNFLMCCLLVLGGGHRSDVIRSMTLIAIVEQGLVSGTLKD